MRQTGQHLLNHFWLPLMVPEIQILDGKVSFAEAFSYASASVKQQYADNGWGILTEHAQLDDNGDKISSEALAADGKDGELAGQIFLK